MCVGVCWCVCACVIRCECVFTPSAARFPADASLGPQYRTHTAQGGDLSRAPSGARDPNQDPDSELSPTVVPLTSDQRRTSPPPLPGQLVNEFTKQLQELIYASACASIQTSSTFRLPSFA